MSVHPVLVICQWIAAVWIHRVLLVVPSKGAQWPRDHTAGCCQVLYKRKKKISSSEEKGSGWVYFILLYEPGSHRRSLSSYKFFRRIVFLSSISAVSFSSLTDLLIFRISLSRKLIFFFISAMEFLRCTVGRKAGFELFLCPTTGLVMFTAIFCLQDTQKSVEERIIRRSCNNLLLKRRWCWRKVLSVVVTATEM